MADQPMGATEPDRPVGAGQDGVAGSSAVEELREDLRATSDHPGLIHAVQSLLYGIVVALLVMTFTAQPFRIPSASMEPTLLVGDFVLVAKGDFGGPDRDHARAGLLPPSTIRRGDVIVFRYPRDPSIHLVKRVVGVPGDRVRLHANQVLIDGHALHEPYALYEAGPGDLYRDNFPQLKSPNPDVASNWWIRMHSLVVGDELTIPPGEYFVLGDNRNDSEDSRYWGLVPAAAIVGRPVLIYFSLNSYARRPTEESLSGSSAQATGDPPERTPRRNLWSAIDSFARWNRTMLIVH